MHHLIDRNALLYEVQIRTDAQDAWAQLCESLDERYPGAKYGVGPEDVRLSLVELSGAIDLFEEFRDAAIHQAAEDELEIEPSRNPRVRLARRPIDHLIAEIRKKYL